MLQLDRHKTSMTFNEAQLKIYEHSYHTPNMPMAVVAGPGTGKTTSLTLRLRALLAAGVDPSTMACITFTNASTNELKTRLNDDPETKNKPWAIQTFHSFILALLRMQVHPPAFQFLTSEVWERYIRDVLLSHQVKHRPPIRIQESELFNLAIEMIETHHHWVEHPPSDPLIKWISHCVQTYYLESPCPFISLRDLETYFWLKLKQGHLPYFPYTHLLIDEFQDTSKVQYDICTYYLNQTDLGLFVVGDAKQSIYAFRKANVENFLAIQEVIRKKEGQIIYLRKNYRSESHIVTVCNDFQQTLLTSISDPLLKAHHATTKESKVQMCSLPSPETLQETLILRCEEAAQKQEQLAILFRTRQPIQDLYQKLHPNIQAVTQTSLWGQRPINQLPYAHGLIHGYLHALYPENTLYQYGWHQSAWKPERNLPRFFLNAQVTFKKLIQLATCKPQTIEDIYSLQLLITKIEEAANVFLPDFPLCMEDHLLMMLDPFSSPTLDVEINKDPSKKAHIFLYTLHASKGLEFDQVILPITKRSIASLKKYPALLEAKRQWGLRYRQSSNDAEWIEAHDYTQLKSDFRQKHIQEELRLLYVGLSRAKYRLDVLNVENQIPKVLKDLRLKPAVEFSYNVHHRLH